MSRATTTARYPSDPSTFFADMIRVITGFAPAPFQVERFALLAPALLALASGTKPPVARFWFEATKGCSKDTDLIIGLLWLLAFSPRRVHAQVGAADFEQAADALKVADSLLRLQPWLAKRLKIDRSKLHCPGTGSQADFIPADVAGSHGSRPDLLVLNELSHVTKEEFAQNMADNAAKMPNGVMVIATNAGHTGTWQYSWRDIAYSNRNRWAIHQWSKPSPWLDPAEVAEAKLRNTATRFNRLFYGIWSPNSGDALDPAAIDECTTLPGQMYKRPHPSPDNWQFVAGLDLGISHDHSALVVLGIKQGDPTIHLAEVMSWAPPKGGQVDLAAVECGVRDVHRRYRLRTLLFDPFQAVMLAQSLSRQHIVVEPMEFVGKNLNLMANTLIDVFNTRSIALYPDAQLIRDLGRLTIVEKSYGYKLESTRDADGHADRATALAICLPAAVEISHQQSYSQSVPHYEARQLSFPRERGVQFDRGNICRSVQLQGGRRGHR